MLSLLADCFGYGFVVDVAGWWPWVEDVCGWGHGVPAAERHHRRLPGDSARHVANGKQITGGGVLVGGVGVVGGL